MICQKCQQKIETRTTTQNSSLHLYFEMIAEALNELGQEFCYTGISGKELSMRYTKEIIKEMFWKPIQETLFGTKSTTKLKTHEMNEIIDVFTKFFADKGVVIEFPSEESLNNKNN